MSGIRYGYLPSWLVVVVLATLCSPAFAAPRVALVIGNGDYARFGDLRNPANDARAMAAKLRALDFTLVGGTAHVDVTRQSMARLLRELDDALARAPGAQTTALVYYSGHGVAEAGGNWLVPVDDGDIRSREDVPDFAIGARSVIRRLEGRGGGLNILILDACRNNPLPSRRKTKGALSKGLARMDAPSNTVIVYAAAPGKVAYDGTGTLSPFTGALLSEMDRPGKRLVDVLGATAAAVERETAGMAEGRQEPWLEMKPLQRAFYFVPPTQAGAGGAAGVEAVSGRVAAEQAAARAYEAAERVHTVEAYEAVARRFPGSIYADLAKAQIGRLAGGAPSAPGAGAGGDAASVEGALGLTRADRVRVQRGLASLGLAVGTADGLFGPRTRSVIGEWQERKGFARTGYLTDEQADVLRGLGEAAVAAAQTEREERRRAERERQARERAERERRERERAAKEAARKAEAERAPGRRFRDCEGSWCPELVVVPSGSYMMGSPASEAGRNDDEGPVHRMRIARPIAVGVTEVTRGEWRRFVEEAGHSTGDGCGTYEAGVWGWRTGRSWRTLGYSQTDAHPVVCVSWEDAKAYVRWLSRVTGEGYRLLSESEWEYVARGGTKTARYWGEREAGQCRHGNGADGALKRRYRDWEWATAGCDDGHVHTSPAGSFSSNGFGLHDVLGNVWEWVEDCWHESYAGAPADGSVWTSGGDCSRRVLRGGSWYSGPMVLRSADRDGVHAGNRSIGVGFRVARTLD